MTENRYVGLAEQIKQCSEQIKQCSETILSVVVNPNYQEQSRILDILGVEMYLAHTIDSLRIDGQFIDLSEYDGSVGSFWDVVDRGPESENVADSDTITMIRYIRDNFKSRTLSDGDMNNVLQSTSGELDQLVNFIRVENSLSIDE